MQKAPEQRDRIGSEASSPESVDYYEVVAHAIDHARHYLPTQGPISVFVHHNTLHSFENLKFEEAVIEGGRVYGCEPYLSEDRYRREFRRGRISIDDLRHALMDDLAESAEETIAGAGSRYTLRLAMLQSAMQPAPEAELQWMLAETDLLTKFRPDLTSIQREQAIQQTKVWVNRHFATSNESAELSQASGIADLVRTTIQQVGGSSKVDHWTESQWEELTVRLLWELCRTGIATSEINKNQTYNSSHFTEHLADAWGIDFDRTINEVLIRFCSCFLDQGFANWSLPHREQGFAYAFAKLYSQPLVVKAAWMDDIRQLIEPCMSERFDAIASIADSMKELDVRPSQVDAFVNHALLGLRGWAGMIWQMETNTPWLPFPAPEGTLNEYLAIRLLLLRKYLSHVAKERCGVKCLKQLCQETVSRKAKLSEATINQRTFQLFELAQICGWTPDAINCMAKDDLKALMHEIQAFPGSERRRIWHMAYERHYRNATLDALTVHTARGRHLTSKKNRHPAYAAIFCIDDREESFRRHLEEVDPECVTASAAGFFAVAMYYRGADHAHYRPLCPNIITPRHYVREESTFSSVDAARRRADRRKRLGKFTHGIHAGSRTVAGGWVTGLFGAVATVPMVARILTPRLAAKVRESFGTWISPPATELAIERTAPEPGPDPDSLGYSLDEMAAIVMRILEDTGLVKNLPPIVILFGHGSSSLNNPHESAYNCGACSGGRGGPNARAFAMMANDPRVRKIISEKGLDLPNSVRFIGAYHNTCSDDVEYYDLDLLPRTHRKLFRRIEESINETRARNAHERARRFESAPLDLTSAEALEHVEERSEDLSQARPEYNHATNALVFVGRREWSRDLFLDRRCFVTSYDPSIDNENASILTRILQAAIPVCAGISLEYYFSTIDSEGYGCGSKLPHNIASLIGVMTGAASDLRPGLSQQMVEIHEPMRILFVIETTADSMLRIVDSNPGIKCLVEGNWVQLAVIDAETSAIELYRKGVFEPYVPETTDLPEVSTSIDWYRGQREHLGFASIASNRQHVKTVQLSAAGREVDDNGAGS